MKALAAHFFRHEYGRLVASLSRRVGVNHLELVEDAVQFALAAALETWPKSTVPENPVAWLHRVAHNRVVEELRRGARCAELASASGSDEELEMPTFLGGEMRDDLLRMLFACCDDALPAESQLVLALKVLCGFDVAEISERLFMSEANVYKRLTRARTRLREAEFKLDELTAAHVRARLPAVQLILYVLFTEGYLSAHPERAIRHELCDEAIRLATELAAHSIGAVPETFALLAMMHLHSARSSARQDVNGGLLLLEEQDRALWNQQEIAVGLDWLARSAVGDTFSRYHAEAGVAAEHCLAPSVSQTRWERIVACYEILERVAPSPIHTLNRAVALAEWKGPRAGLEVLEEIAPPSWLEGSYLWAAVLADLHHRAGDEVQAEHHRITALASAPSTALRAVLERRLCGARS